MTGLEGGESRVDEGLHTFFNLRTWTTAPIGAVVVLLAIRALRSGQRPWPYPPSLPAALDGGNDEAERGDVAARARGQASGGEACWTCASAR